MSILFIGKRFYTNRDAYTEKFGRIYQLPYYWSKEKKTILWLIDYHSKEKIKDQHDSLKILSTPILSLFFILTILKVILVHRPKTIIASGDCYIGLFTYILAKLCGSKFILDVYDKYDTFSGYRNLGFKNLFKFLLKNAEICFFASKKLKSDCKYICKKSILVPNGVDTNHFYPRNRNSSRYHFNLDINKIYLGYFGSMEIERGIDDLIKVTQILREKNKNIYILLAGKKRKDLNIDYDFIHYLGNISFSDVPLAMACCNLLTLPYRNSNFLDNASSCKISEYISMNIPIIATKSENTLNTLSKNSHQNVIFCPLNDLNEMSSSIEKQIFIPKSNHSHKPDILTWYEISKISFKN